MPNLEASTDIKLSKHAELLKTDHMEIGPATVLADFGKSFVQSAAIDPVWNGLGQLATAGHLPRVSIINEENAKRSQADAWAQKFGSAFGVAADFAILSKGKKAIFGAGPSTEALAAMPFQERAWKHAVDGMKLGAVYGAVFTPSDPKENLLWGRVSNAGSQAITFGMLNYGAEFLGSAKMFQNIKPGTSAMVWKDMTVNGLAGFPAGATGVVADSVLRGKELKLSNMMNAATDYAIIGFAMAGFNHGIGTLSAADANGITTARHMTDKIGITKAPELAGKQAEFRIVDGKADFDGFYGKRLTSSAPAETMLKVQQKLHGAFSGIFGERFASYSETRPMLLRHGNEFTAPAELAGSLGLIATCEPLAAKFNANDVFPGRSSSSDRAVWLQPKGENGFRLSRGEKPATGELSAPEAVMLGLPRLEPLDATKILVGEELDANSHFKLRRDAEGKLWADPKPESQGIWTRLNPGLEAKIQASDLVYSGDLQIAPALLEKAASMPEGSRMNLNHQLNATVKSDGLYIKGPNSIERIFIKAPPGPVEIAPTAKFVHLGPDGFVPITNKLVSVPKAKPEAAPKPAETATESEIPTATPVEAMVIDPLVPVAPLTRINPLEKLEPPKAAKDRPVVNVPVEDLGSLASRLTGTVIDPKDPAWRLGKFGEVVLDPALGGVDAGDGTIRIVFGDYDAALSAGRFTTGVFKRRLQSDPQDRSTAPRMKVTVDEFQDPAGTPLFVPVLDIDGLGAGRLVLGDNLRPLGIQNSTNLITIDQKPKR
ncbi:MAG: hypothetical protein K2X27_13755 [Candidatus Obscuribacterales bacterium]|nr:hypothetical protein [Candidatus Obscuribacterales bacterium]